MASKQTNPPNHQAQVKKLNRVAGQIEGIKKMIEDRRYCLDILTQTRAAASALRAVELSIIEAHLGHCVSEALTSKNARKANAKIDELIEIVKRF